MMYALHKVTVNKSGTVNMCVYVYFLCLEWPCVVGISDACPSACTIAKMSWLTSDQLVLQKVG